MEKLGLILEPVSAGEIADLRRDYLASLTAPIDGMWEAFAAMGRHWEIRCREARAGYICVNEQGQLLQFYVEGRFESFTPEFFAGVIARDEVDGAIVSTADPLFLGLCLDAHKQVRVHTFLYRDHHRGESGFKNAAEASLDVVQADELAEVAELQRDSLDQDPGDWLIGYLENLIARRELYALRVGGEIVGTGEARVSDSQPPFVDLGVITMRRHRRQGVATDILWRLKQICKDRELVPICSTTSENLGAQRAIAQAGFISRHRILEVEL